MNNPILQLFFVAAVTMGLSHTIAREKIFEPVRNACGGFKTWPGYLISCPYCASHWIAFALVPLTGTYPLHVAIRWPVIAPVLDWFLSAILVTVIAAMLRVVFYWVDEGQRLTKTKKRVVESEVEERERAIQ